VGWAGPAQLTGLDSAQKGVGRYRPIKDLGQSRPNKVLYFRLGQTWPKQPGWARVSLAHEHIRNGPEPVWPRERNPSVLGQNRPGPALDDQPVGGINFPPILLHAERTFCMQEENAENQNEYRGKKSVPDAEEAVPCWLNCFAGGAVVALLAALWWRPVAVSWLTDGSSKQ